MSLPVAVAIRAAERSVEGRLIGIGPIRSQHGTDAGLGNEPNSSAQAPAELEIEPGAQLRVRDRERAAIRDARGGAEAEFAREVSGRCPYVELGEAVLHTARAEPSEKP